jgi:cell division protein FtsW (lipid II flippase)
MDGQEPLKIITILSKTKRTGKKINKRNKTKTKIIKAVARMILNINNNSRRSQKKTRILLVTPAKLIIKQNDLNTLIITCTSTFLWYY